MYFNTVGGIKVPAPIHYAHRLSSMINENSKKDVRIKPHEDLGNSNSLYFI